MTIIDNYSRINNLPDITFISGDNLDLDFTIYDEDGITSLSCNALTWNLCPYGDFTNLIVSKSGTANSLPSTQFVISLEPEDTNNLMGKFIQQIIVTDYNGNTFVTGQ